MVVLPKDFGVGRKSGSCIAQASGQCCLETQLAWAHVAVNGLFRAQCGEQSWGLHPPWTKTVVWSPSALLPHALPQALCWGDVSPQPHLRPTLA